MAIIPVRYVQTLGAVAGIPQVIEVIIDCGARAPVLITTSGRPSVPITCTARAPIIINVRPTAPQPWR